MKPLRTDHPPSWARPLAEAFAEHLEQDVSGPFRSLEARFDEWFADLLSADLLEALSPTAEDLGRSVLSGDFLIPLDSDDEAEAHFGLGAEDTGIVVRRGAARPRIDRYRLSGDAEEELQEARRFLRRLDGWRGRGLLLGLSISAKYNAGVHVLVPSEPTSRRDCCAGTASRAPGVR